ncbi:bifunctional 3-(3-hydroxy-phenyl)propionate/3-hydroxycinnamic acid hydroxylase [Rhodococcus sp. NPDC003318]|uniref:bifunctional 3-(3-hydroxy-phenyl)propionate/3-hydroxycinnamic acid hydroxylase n=1 Tax=Rhodococcus sp. NPDC003318 TaxID=3364503 RepID=UPI00369E7A45
MFDSNHGKSPIYQKSIPILRDTVYGSRRTSREIRREAAMDTHPTEPNQADPNHAVPAGADRTEPRRRFDVALCGAGPVGMTAAALLAARGLDVVVLERRLRTSDEPKAISIDDEALRIYQQAGLADTLLELIVPGTGTRYYGADGRPLFDARATVPFRLGFPFKNPFAQPDLERALAGALAANPRVDLRFGTEVRALTQDADTVTVSTTSGDVEASYLLGCDGGRSTVRELLGGTMTGRSHPDVWLVVDALGDHHVERFGMHHGDPERPHVIIPGLGGRCRYEFRLFEGEGEPTDTPPFDLIHRLVSRYREITPDQVERAVNYRFHGLVADDWQVGRCFLLGDAAHMMPPFAGQGLNSGIRDAGNLAWKLAEVFHGRLDPSVLATYQTERRPHAAAVVRSSEQLGRVVMTTSPALARRRDARARSALATPAGREFLEEMRYRPAHHYRTGLVTGDGPDIGVPLGQPRVFDVRTHRTVLLDEVVGDGWALLAVDITDEDAVASADGLAATFGTDVVLVTVNGTMPRTDRRVLVDVDGGLAREFGSYRGRFVLLRPDHFVAAAWGPDQHDAVADALPRWSARTPAPTA